MLARVFVCAVLAALLSLVESTSVQDVINAVGCSELPVKGISQQIIQVVNTLYPDLLARIDDTVVIQATSSYSPNPFLQLGAKNAIKRAWLSYDINTKLDVQSVLRTLPQAMLWSFWSANPSWRSSCGTYTVKAHLLGDIRIREAIVCVRGCRLIADSL